MSKARYIPLAVVAALFLLPIGIVLMNAFKGQFYIADAPFALPDRDTFVGFDNFLSGIEKTDFFAAFVRSLWITAASTVVLTVLPAMTAWYLVRVGRWWTRLLYYLFAAGMIVPFQMVMYPMSQVVNFLRLDNPLGIVVVYLGFGAGMSVFLYAGFVQSLPTAVEEAARIDGCREVRLFFSVVLPLLRPISVTVAIVNTMWIWNDYLLPYLLIGQKWRTIPIAVQYLQGGYGSRDMGALMAVLVLALIPVVVGYLSVQKYVVRGIIAGAVKG